MPTRASRSISRVVVRWILALVLMAATIVGCWNANHASIQSTKAFEQACAKITPERHMVASLASLAERLLGGEIRLDPADMRSINALFVQGLQKRKSATQWTILAIGLGAAGILSVYRLPTHRTIRCDNPCLTYALAMAAVFFVTGISTPILSHVVYKEAAVVGPIIATYQAKSILTSIPLLYENSGFLAIIVVLFSLIVPLTKFTLMFGAVLFPGGVLHRFHHIGQILGKWSMLEMLLVAVLVVVFSVDGLMTARGEHGIYFYTTHCMITIIIGIQMSKRAG